ncbi:hypothetical protein DY000_02029871, partial [Brassica cretica]
LDDDGEVIGGYPSQQPIGVKASKLKGGNVDQTSLLIYTLQEGNRQLLEQLKKINAQKQRFLDIQKKSYALAEFKEEKKILLQDLSSIQDPNIRVYLQAEQTRIIQQQCGESTL